MNTRPISPDRLNRLIDRYFNGATSLADERRLREALADPRYEGANVDAARAVMGVFAASRRLDSAKPSLGLNSRHRRGFSAIASAAASIALLFVASVALTARGADNDLSKAYARVGTTTINDPNAISQMIVADLASISEASASVEESIFEGLSVFDDIK